MSRKGPRTIRAPEAAASGLPTASGAGALEGRLYGLDLVSDFPLLSHLDRRRGGIDLRFSCGGPLESSRDGARWNELPLLYASGRRAADGESVTRLRGGLAGKEPRHLLSFAGVADYLLEPGRIHCYLRNPEVRFLVEIRLLGPVIAFWLESQGFPALHAASVVVDGQAVGLLGANGAGKTSLAAALLAAGHPLLSDDILVLEESNATRGGGDPRVLGRPGYPQMRLWPEQAERFLDPGWESLPLVHPEYAKRRVPIGQVIQGSHGGPPPASVASFGSFHPEPSPLARLYLLKRQSSAGVEITPIAPRDAMIELVRHSFSPHLVEAAGFQADRLGRFARLLAQAPLRRLSYPSGWDQLPAVLDAVHRDLEA